MQPSYASPRQPTRRRKLWVFPEVATDPFPFTQNPNGVVSFGPVKKWKTFYCSGPFSENHRMLPRQRAGGELADQRGRTGLLGDDFYRETVKFSIFPRSI
jgi:hypothetical protein